VELVVSITIQKQIYNRAPYCSSFPDSDGFV